MENSVVSFGSTISYTEITVFIQGETDAYWSQELEVSVILSHSKTPVLPKIPLAFWTNHRQYRT